MADKNYRRSNQKYSVFSLEYKNSVTERAIHRAFLPSLGNEEEYVDPTYPAWTSPPIYRRFNFATFLSLYDVRLRRAAPLLFYSLRTKYWDMNEDAYNESLSETLEPVDGLGFSGSLFYFTSDKSYIIKSVGRSFEYTFLYTEYIEHQAKFFEKVDYTLLTKITDVLFCFDRRLGGLLNLSPAHYVVMENILKDMDPGKGWKKWDLKPQQFFEPTRDLIPDKLKTRAAKSGLADALTNTEDMIYLTQKQKDQLFRILDRDTSFLEQIEVIDYSILLGRYPTEGNERTPQPENFTTGVTSSDGKFVYKMCLLDTLWNVNQLVAKLTKAAGKLMPEQTVTTEPSRYRKEFMAMMEEYVIVE